MSVENLFNGIEQRLVNHKHPEERKIQFRCSSLPMCPVAWILGSLIYDGKIPGKLEFRSDFYMSVGTTVHTVVQRWLGRTGDLYGNWICENIIPAKADLKVRRMLGDKLAKRYFRKCGYRIKNRCGTPVCKKCGSEMVYEEFEVVEEETGLSGHIDSLFKYKNGFWISDFKTIGIERFEEIEQPQESYLAQVNSYANMLSRPPYNLRIYGTSIWYIQRDNPVNMKLFLSEGYSENNFQFVLEQFRRTMSVLKKNKFNNLDKYRTCSQIEEGKDCHYSAICFSNDLGQAAKRYASLK